MRTTRPLADWRFASIPPGRKPHGAELWRPARVPGDVRSDLLALGLIPDPYYADNCLKLAWIDETDWLYGAEFEASPPGADRRVFLELDGIDYRYEIELNGAPLLAGEGMFAGHCLDVTDRLGPRNSLSVRLFALEDRALDRLLAPWIGNQFSRHERLKTQMSYGWDFAPAMKNAGLWGPVRLVETGPARIMDLRVRGRTSGRVRVAAEIDSTAELEAELRLAVLGDNFHAEPCAATAPVALRPGLNMVELELKLRNPRLWTVWEKGFPHLYRLRAELTADATLSDAAGRSFGLREIERRSPDPEAGPEARWTFFINGRPQFIRGFNWAPPDSMLGRLNAGRYRTLVGRAREANANLLRVWGGGLREQPAFYDICDRAGIMVWQEFPFACCFFRNYPRTPEFKALVEREASAVVRQLRNHPSVALWSGGNEFSQIRNPHLVRLLDRVQREHDGTREFIPASPCPGASHNYQVWHCYGGLRRYAQEDQYFVSEFGLQAVPGPSSLRRFIPEPELWPPGRSWIAHKMQAAKAARYALPFLKKPDLEGFAAASQAAQAFYLKMGIEMWRRRKPRMAGTVIWQLNEPWPAVSWALVDYFDAPKQAFYMLKDVYNPVLVCLAYEPRRFRPGQRFAAGLWIVNDLERTLPGAELTVANSGGRELLRVRADIDADSARKVADLEIAALGPEDLGLELELSRDREPLARNSYDLTLYDPMDVPGVMNRLTHRLHNWIMR